MKFIRLNNILINPATIRSIMFSDAKYIIHFASECVDGTILFGSGGVSSHQRKYVIDKKENPSDYRVMECWISKNEHF